VKQTEKYDTVRALVAPHAGYKYSGLAASYAYQTVKGKSFTTVIVLSPSHTEYFRGVCVFAGDAYRTPFGDVPVNKTIAQKLITDDGAVFMGQKGHGREHAVEVHLPFLQFVLGDFDFVPVVMGDQSAQYTNVLAEKLRETADPSVLIVASSDLSHYYPREFAERLDGRVAKHLNSFDVTGLESDLRSRACEACGGGLIVSTMKAFHSDKHHAMKTLYRCDSGDVSGDTSEVVGYLAAAIYH
jgi:AmmeMemoRadiSam system protein B